MAGKGYEVGTAYVAIMPQTKTLTQELSRSVSSSGFAKACEREGKSAGDSMASKIKGALKTIAVVEIGKQIGGKLVQGVQAAMNSYADYEQLEGGIQKLFGNMGQSVEEYAAATGRSVDDVRDEWSALETAQNTVLKNSENAFRTAGLSQNEYMETVTGFSASLISSLDGDTVAAAAVADKAITDMSDNANTFGTDMEAIQNAYMGFAKDNFTMLDNLKLGYGGTKTEMERLIADANAVKEANGEMADLSIDSFADMVEAIHIVQEQQNIAGTTAREASSTISGSAGMMSAAWANLVTNLGKDNIDIGESVSALVDSVLTWFGNVSEKVPVIFSNAKAAVSAIIGEIGSKLPEWLGADGTTLVDKGMEIIGGLLLGAVTRRVEFATMLSELGVQAAQWIGNNFDEVVAKGGEIIGAVISGITTVGENLITIFTTLASSVVEWIGSNWSGISAKGQELLNSLIEGINSIVPDIVTFFTNLPSNVLTVLGSLASTLDPSGNDLINGLLGGINSIANGELKNKIVGLPGELLEFIGDTAGTLGAKGRSFIRGFLNGVSELVNGDAATTLGGLLNTLGGFVGSALQTLWQVGTDFISGLLSGVTDARDGDGKEFFGGLLETLKSFITTGIDVLTFLGSLGTDLISGFLDGVSGGKWTELKEWFAKLPDNAKEQLGDLTSTLKQKGKDFLDGLKQGAADKIKVIETTMKNLPSNLVKKVGNIANSLKQKGKDFLTGFKNGAENIGSQVGNWIGKLPSTLVKLIGSLGSKLLQKGKDFLGGFKTGVENIGSQVGNWIGNLPSTLVTLIGNLGTKLLQKGKDLLQGFFDGIKNIFESPTGVSDFFSNIGETIKGFIPDPIKMLESIGGDVIQGFINGLQSISLRGIVTTVFGEELGNAICDVLGIESPSKVTKEYGKYTTQGFANGLKDSSVVKSVKENAKSLRGTVTDGIGDTSTLLNGKGKSATQSFANGINDTDKKNGVKTKSNGLRGWVTSGVGDTSGLLTEKGSKAAWSFANGVADKEANKSVKDTASSLRGALSGNLEGISSWSWGYDFVINFKNGMEYAYSYLKQTADTILNGVTAMFGHSVPKEGPMHDDDVWGLHFIENFAHGMEKGRSLLDETVKNVAASTAVEFKTGVDWSSADWTNRQVQISQPDINITGNTFYVRDDHDIELIAEQLSTMINRQIAGALA